MMDKRKRKELLITLAAFLVVFILMMFYEGVFSKEDTAGTLTALSNAFFVPGALCLGTGLLSFVASKGMFDGLAYSFSNFGLHNLLPGKNKDKYESYYDYTVRKSKKRKRWLYITASVGGCAVLAGVILALIAG